MTTILHVTPAYKPAFIYGGPTFSVSRLCEELHKTDYEITVLTTNANGLTDLDVDTNKPVNIGRVNVHYCKRLTGDHTHFSPALIRQLIALIKASKAAPEKNLIIHIHSWWNTVAIAAAMVSRFYHVPLVVSPRGMLTPYSIKNRHSLMKGLFHQFIGKPLLKRCYLHATTIQEMSDLQEIGVKPRKIHVIPNLPTFKACHVQRQFKLPHAAGVLKLLFLSRIEEKKGLDLLLEALSMVKTKWHLTIVGDGNVAYMNQLIRSAIDLNIYRCISWLDAIYGSAKFQCMTKHDFLLLPSYNENFANVVLESLSVGTPVIISNQVGLSDYVIENNLGWVSTQEPENIAAIIEKAAADHKKRKWIRREAPQLILRDFQDKKLIHAYSNMYQEIIQHES